MIELFIFFTLLLATGVGLKHWVYDPFASGTHRIDPYQYPTLARTQRILRARNVKKRELEAKKTLRELQDHKNAIEHEASAKSIKALDVVRKQHTKDINQWTSQFNTLLAPALAREQEERQRAERAAWEERRDRERKIWTEAEAERVKKQQELEAKAAKLREEALLLHEQEQAKQRFIAAGGLIAPASTRYNVFDNDASYGDRKVSVHGVHVRKSPSTSSKILANLVQYQKVSVDGWTTSQELYGNGIWFHLKASDVHPGGWLWSGAVDNKSTSGLRRMAGEIKLSADPQDSLDRLAELSDSQVDILQKQVRDAFNSIGGSGEPTAYDVDRMNDLADANERINAEKSRRTALAQKTRTQFTQNSENAFATLAEMHANPKKYLIAQEIAEVQSEISAMEKKNAAFGEVFREPPTINATTITADKLYL